VFGKRLFVSIRPIEWMENLKRIQLEQKIYEQVKRMCAMCRDIYDYAKVTGRIDYNPLDGRQKYLIQGKKENIAQSRQITMVSLYLKRNGRFEQKRM